MFWSNIEIFDFFKRNSAFYNKRSLNMSKSIKTQSKISKKKFPRKKIFGQKLNFLAHSGGWIVLKIIFRSIFSHLVSKLVGFWVIIALFKIKKKLKFI